MPELNQHLDFHAVADDHDMIIFRPVIVPAPGVDPRFPTAHYGHDLKVGDSHEALTFHKLTVVDLSAPNKPGPARRDWDRPGYDVSDECQAPALDMRPGGPNNFDLGNHAPRAATVLVVNPKDAIGANKLPLHLWPAEATAMGCLGMLEGMLKYGLNNMIAADGVVASIYIDAAMRHLMAWFEGEECAPDTGTPHLANALATIAIVVKCIAHGKLIDDRNYGTLPDGARYRQLVDELTPHVARLKEMFKEKDPKHFTIADVVANDGAAREAA